jgi:hypothetical protein
VEITMRSMMVTWTSGAASVALMVLCLWAWQHAGDFSVETSRPDVATLAVRSAALAIAAAAQILLLTLVIGKLYRRQLIDDVLKLAAALVFAVTLVGAVALGLAAR